MDRNEKRTATADVRIVGGDLGMSREKKDAKNFACKFDREIFEKLEEFCELSGQNKTAVVERAVEKYIEENLEMIKEVAKKL